MIDDMSVTVTESQIEMGPFPFVSCSTCDGGMVLDVPKDSAKDIHDILAPIFGGKNGAAVFQNRGLERENERLKTRNAELENPCQERRPNKNPLDINMRDIVSGYPDDVYVGPDSIRIGVNSARELCCQLNQIWLNPEHASAVSELEEENERLQSENEEIERISESNAIRYNRQSGILEGIEKRSERLQADLTRTQAQVAAYELLKRRSDAEPTSPPDCIECGYSGVTHDLRKMLSKSNEENRSHLCRIQKREEELESMNRRHKVQGSVVRELSGENETLKEANKGHLAGLHNRGMDFAEELTAGQISHNAKEKELRDACDLQAKYIRSQAGIIENLSKALADK